MEGLIILLQSGQDADGLPDISGLHHDFLESSVQGSVFFHDFGELVHCCCTDALDFTPCKSRLQHIGGIQTALAATCADDGMELVYEKYDVRVAADRLDYVLDPLLEVSAVFGSGHYRGNVKGDDAFPGEDRGY